MMNSLLSSLLLSLFFSSSFGFVPSLTTRRIETSVNYSEDSLDRPDAAEPLPLTVEDLQILTELKSRKTTMPIVLMESLLPGQRLHFSSNDPKFIELIKHALSSESNEIGIIGFNPINGEPLTKGVTAVLDKDELAYDARAISLSLQGKRCFEVVGNPRMDYTQSFYLADVEIVDNRKEILSEELEERANEIFGKIPKQVDEWSELILKTENKVGLNKRMREIGPMPEDSLQKRAIWVGSLVNPIPELPQVCPEIRPAMLACRNDHDRLVLASAALQSSIDHLKQQVE